MSPGIRRAPETGEREEEMRRAEREILHALREIRYGSLEITIHDSRVVQIERREKVRLER